MRSLEIEYDEEREVYSFTCPFCSKEHILNDDSYCPHILFVYEQVNNATLYFDSSLEDYVRETLLSKRVNFLSSFQEVWEDRYKPEQDSRSSDPEAWDEAKSEAVSYYLEEGFSPDSLFKVLRCTGREDWLNRICIAELDDLECGTTSYVLIDNQE